ncbi:MAG: hypothetical protein Q9M19_06830, partial [Mariprofundaceae bacterium]|nr:hypothetical protein [Mariprofundaceae bacterium]
VLERGEFILALGMQQDAKKLEMPQAAVIRVALDELACLEVGIRYLEQHDRMHNQEVVLRYMKTGFFKLS